MPRLTNKFKQAIEAAPAPDATKRTSSIFLSTIRNALITAAALMIAVPCWSSWKTGIFMRSRNLRSI